MDNTALHRLRRDAEFRSSDDLADAVGMERALWRRCEDGLAGIPDQVAPRVSEALGVSELELEIMSASSQAHGRYRDEIATELPDGVGFDSLIEMGGHAIEAASPQLFVLADEGLFTAIDASSVSECFVESFSTREAAEAWLVKPCLDPSVLRGWEDGRLGRGPAAVSRAPSHVALEIDATWARSVAGEIGVALSDREAEEMARCAADNLYASDLLAEVAHDQLVAEIENYDERRCGSGAMTVPAHEGSRAQRALADAEAR